MDIYAQPDLSEPSPCPYLPGQTLVFEYFFAGRLRGHELDWFLSRGWRKFGHYFFRPACPNCQACTPLRVCVDSFSPSRSQKRVARRGREISTFFGPIRYEARLFELYCAHGRERFGEDCSFDEFAANLHLPSCPGLLSRYIYQGELVGAGYLDQGETSLSSVYFVFDPKHSRFGLGNLSVLREIEKAKGQGLAYYYLGYMVADCSRMAYKASFYPHQLYSWSDNTWHTTKRPKNLSTTGQGQIQT